jgi:TP901 family phage tail tape measure protein
MGFAGQIFAARVAVGLAVPSSQALSSAGQTLANGVGAIYGRLNKKRIESAKQREAQAKQEMNKANSDLERFRANAGARLRSGAATELANLNKNSKAVSNSVKNSAMSAKGLMAGMQATLKPKLAGQLMAGVSKSMGHLEKAQQMTRNFLKMKKSEREIVMDVAKTNHKNAIQAVKDNEKEKIAVADKITLIREEQQAHADIQSKKRGRPSQKFKEEQETYLKQIDALNGVTESLAKKDAKLQKTVSSTEEELNVMGHVNKARELGLKSSKDEERQLDKNAKAKEKKYNKATKETARVLKQATTAAAQFGNKIASNAQSLAGNFSNSLRDTIAVMTAFYYKLSQNTQELINFEKELMNANSVFNVTKQELFETSNQIVQFGQQFGIEMQNGATGLYQLASAGLSADESMQMLPHTLKLSAAVQGDHNTIAKLTTQTIAGFGMEAEDAAVVTDKFAHAIQKSLIEYEDLSSAVKFALPFFTSTGQSLDQLLGALQVLTNRALEAGIAGRGLRQALSEFAESAMDAESGFRQMGVEILNAEGNMKPLTEIAAQFKAQVGESVNNTELLTTLIEGLNVRGATAFIHLVQASDEFTEAVENSKNAGGELDEMVRIQTESMAAQIQILKNNIQMIFFHSDGVERANGAMNEFHSSIIDGITALQNLFVTLEGDKYVLTSFGQEIQNIGVNGVALFTDLLKDAIELVRGFTQEGMVSTDMLKLFTLPLKVTLEVLQMLGPNFVKMLLYYQVLNKILPITIALESAANKEGMLNNIIRGTGNKIMVIGNALMAATNMLRENGIRGTYQKIGVMVAESNLKKAQISQGVVANAIFAGEIKMTQNATRAYLAKAGAMALAAAPYIAMAVVIGLIATSFAILVKETGMFNLSMANIKLELMAVGGVMMHVFEEKIMPVLYTIGLEWMALSAILAFAMIKIGALVVEYVINPFKFLLFEILMPIGRFLISGIVSALGGMASGVKKVVGFAIKLKDRITEFFDVIQTYGPFVINHLKNKLINLKDDTIESIRSKTMEFLGVYVELGDYVRDTLQGAFETLLEKMQPLFDGANNMRDAFEAAAGHIADLVGSLNILDLDVLDKLSALNPLEYLATGGYVKPMASGGMMGARRPYVVGERGPELFMPSSSGQVINNTRTESIMRQGLNAGPATKGGAQDLVVSQLVVGNAKLKNTRMAVDSFAGVV